MECLSQGVIRPFSHGEDALVRACLTDEYGTSYYTRDYYEKNYFTQKTACGSMDILLWMVGSECAGFLILKNDSYSPSQTELSTMVIKKKFRSMGGSTPLIKAGMALVLKKDINACFGHSQVFHDISIRKLYELGLRPTGFLMSMFIADKLSHSFGKTKSPKLPWTITMLPQKKTDAGRLFIAPHLREVTARIYDNLGVAYEIHTDGEAPMRGNSVVEEQYNAGQNTLILYVRTCGDDLYTYLSEIAGRYPQELFTVNLWLNVQDEAAVAAYDGLRSMGFFFTGYQALAKDAEFMILNKSFGTPIFFEDFAPFEPVQYLLDFVKTQYEETCYEKEH